MRAVNSFLYLGLVLAPVLMLLQAQPAAARLININTATEQELDELPSIGPSRASSIVRYREEHGPFRHKEDIMKIHGIGPGIYGGLKDSITVGTTAETRSRTEKKAVPLEPFKVHAGRKYIPRGCWSCKNGFYVPEDLKKGWCPFCGKKWSIK